MTTGLKVILGLVILILGYQITTERRITKIEGDLNILLQCFSEKIKEILKG